MRVVLKIAKRFVLSIVKRKASVLWMVVLPIVFTFLFGVLPSMSSHQRVPVAVVDLDHSQLSQALVHELERNPDLQILQMNRDEALQALREQSASMVLQLPGGFQDQVLANQAPHLTILPAANQGGNPEVFLTATQELKDIAQSWSVAGQVALQKHVAASDSADTKAKVSIFLDGARQSSQLALPIAVHQTAVHDGTARQVLPQGQQAVIGFSTMFIMLIVFAATSSILVEKRFGTWARLKASPAAKWTVMGGYVLGIFLVGWIQYAIVYATGRWLFQIQVPMNGWMVLTVSLYILAACGIALCNAGLVKTAEQQMAMGSFVAVATSMLGGAYWPIDVEPTWMQHVAWLVPQNWTMEAFRIIVAGMPSLSALMWPLTVLAGFTVIFFTAGIVQLRYS
jgi:ABC-2 type transport system permease protein